MRKLRVPNRTHMLQDASAHRDGRQPLDIRRGVPGQQVGRAIHTGMAQPGFRRGDETSRVAPTLVARKETNRHTRVVAIPGKSQRAARRFTGRRLVMTRRQRVPRLHHSGRDQLRNHQHADLPGRLLRVHVGDCRIGRPQIDPHDVTRRPADLQGGRTVLSSKRISNDEARNTQARRNDESQMTNDEGSPHDQGGIGLTFCSSQRRQAAQVFDVLRHSFVLGYFVLRHSPYDGGEHCERILNSSPLHRAH